MESYLYDANGNILKLLRNGTTAGGRQLAMDNLTYWYKYTTTANTTATYNPQAALPANFKERLNNQLTQVTDAVAATNYPLAAFPNEKDIDNQTNANNYTYDRIGNLYTDASEGITAIQWTVYGKIRSITKTVATVTTNIKYDYDASGNRIAKQVTTGALTTSTYYLRDVQGNVLALYEKATATAATLWNEQHLYGSSRLGMWQVPATQPTAVQEPAVGSKLFELTNHLGNVLVTISDKKLGVDANTDGIVDFYTAEVMSATDYYAGGMELPGRNFSASIGYRYSINGQEKTPEIAPNTTTAEFWQYDSRIIRRWNVDPVQKEWESPYLCFSGNPIWLSDRKGDNATIEKPGLSENNRIKGAEITVTARKLRKTPKTQMAYMAAANTMVGLLIDRAKTDILKKLPLPVGAPEPTSLLSKVFFGVKDGLTVKSAIEDLYNFYEGSKRRGSDFPFSEVVSNLATLFGKSGGANIALGLQVLQAAVNHEMVNNELHLFQMKGGFASSGQEGLSIAINGFNRDWGNTKQYKDLYMNTFYVDKDVMLGIANSEFISTNFLMNCSRGMKKMIDGKIHTYQYMIYAQDIVLKNPLVSRQNIGYIKVGEGSINNVLKNSW